MQTRTVESEWNNLLPPNLPANPGFELDELGADRHRLRIWGRFLPGWLSGLSAGLALKQISIIGGAAEKVSPSAWFARLEIQAEPALAKSIDYLALAGARRTMEEAAQIVIDNFNIRMEHDTGELYVEVCGEDQVGFLDAVLKKFTLYSLFPARMILETEAGKVFDRFWFKGIGGASPSTDTVSVVRNELRILLEHT